MKELVAIGGDADAVRARVEGRAQRLADYNHRCAEDRGLASADSGAAFENLGEANKANARSQLSETRRGPSGDERAEHNLYAQCSKERSKAGLFDFAHLVSDKSNFSFQDFEDEA